MIINSFVVTFILTFVLTIISVVWSVLIAKHYQEFVHNIDDYGLEIDEKLKMIHQGKIKAIKRISMIGSITIALIVLFAFRVYFL